MASKAKLKPFNPLHITGRSGLCTSSDINRVEDLIHSWSAEFIGDLTAQLAVITPNVPVTPPGASRRSYSFRLGPNTYISSTGAEQWMDQVVLDLTGFASTITVNVTCEVSSASETANFRARLGGGDQTVDGTVVGTMPGPSVGFVVVGSTMTLANPGGKPRLKFTLQSSASASKAVAKSITVTVN